MEIGTVTSRYLCFLETALSRLNRKVRLPKGTPYSASFVQEFIESSAACGFDIPIPDGANFVEVSIPSWVLRPYREARQAHPNAAKLPPMVVVERGTLEHLNAILKGGPVFVSEDPLNPTILDEDHPLKGILQGRLDSKQS